MCVCGFAHASFFWRIRCVFVCVHASLQCELYLSVMGLKQSCPAVKICTLMLFLHVGVCLCVCMHGSIVGLKQSCLACKDFLLIAICHVARLALTIKRASLLHCSHRFSLFCWVAHMCNFKDLFDYLSKFTPCCSYCSTCYYFFCFSYCFFFVFAFSAVLSGSCFDIPVICSVYFFVLFSFIAISPIVVPPPIFAFSALFQPDVYFAHLFLFVLFIVIYMFILMLH